MISTGRISYRPVYLAAAVAVAGTLLAGSASASTVIYNNFSEDPASAAYPYSATAFGYGVQWNQNAVWPGTSSFGFGAQEAMPFTVQTGQDIPLQGISLAMYKWPSNTQYDAFHSIGTNHNNLTIEIVGNKNGLPNLGNVLEVLAVNPVIPEDSTSFLDLTSATHPLLKQGEIYWVVAMPTVIDTNDTGDDSLYLWVGNQEGAQFNDTVNEWAPFGLNNWTGFFSQPKTYDAPTLEVLGVSAEAVPEPASLLLLGSALAGLGATLRRRA